MKNVASPPYAHGTSLRGQEPDPILTPSDAFRRASVTGRGQTGARSTRRRGRVAHGWGQVPRPWRRGGEGAESVSLSISRIGVYQAALAVESMGWIFREQPIEDQGIDGHVETAELSNSRAESAHRRGTGRLIAVQIKAGPSWFSEPSADGWWFRFDETHARLWLNHSLPVIVMLVNVDDHEIYWQEISDRTVQAAGESFKVNVPSAQTLLTAAAAWQDLADGASKVAPKVFEFSLEQLPPSVKKLLVHRDGAERHDAALIAYHLAKGQHNAAGVVASLLATQPTWITRNDGWGWRALGNYGASHELGLLAAEALERAGATGGADAGRCYVAAAMNAIEYDRRAARTYTDQAEEHGAGASLIAVLRAVLDHPQSDAGPINMPPGLLDESDGGQSSALVENFLYVQAQRRGDVADALRHSELMLAVDPTDTGAMVGRAEAILWAAAVQHVESAYLAEAVALLKAALSQRRLWGGPTAKPTIALAKACLLTGDFRLMLDVCLPSPSGSASVADAGDAEVRHLGIHAAVLLGRRDLVSQLVEDLADTPEGRLAQYRVGSLRLSDDQLTELLLQDFHDAVTQEDFARAVQRALGLAELGADVMADLVPYVERSIIQANTMELGKHLLVASRDFESGLPALRELARSDKQAAEVLVGLLSNRGRLRETVDVCDAILTHGHDSLFAILRANALVDLEDPAAEREALDAVARGSGFPIERGRLLTYAAAKAAERNDWVTAERRLAEVLNILESPDSASVWRLVTAHVHLGQLDRATSLIDRYQPQVRNDEDAALWLTSTASEAWDASRASEALTLAARVTNPKLAVALLGHIVTTTHGVDEAHHAEDEEDRDLEGRRREAQQPVPAELHRQAFLAMESLVERYGDQTGMFILRGEPEDLVDRMSSMLKDGEARDKILMDLQKQVRDSLLPMGFVATLSGRGYATLLVQRAFGPMVSASPEDAEYAREVDSATQSLNGEVVIDASALLTLSALSSSSLVGQFGKVTVPASVLQDIHRAATDVRASAGSPGGVRWDGATGGLRLTELPKDEFIRQLRRAEALKQFALTLPVATPAEGDLLARLEDRVQFAPWVDPIQLAHERECALWTDDLGMRRLAAVLGVAAFGTVGLLDAVRARELTQSATGEVDGILQRFAEATRSLASDMVVDLPLEPQDIVRIAEVDDWYPRGGAAAISRQAWWVWQARLGAEPITQVLALFARVALDRRESLPAWQLSAMVGASRALKAEFVSRGLCELALLAWGPSSSDDDIVDGMARARAVADEFGLRDPALEISAAAAHLSAGGLLDDPEAVAERILARIERDKPNR